MKLGFILDSEYIPADLTDVFEYSKKTKNFSVDLVIVYSSTNRGNDSYFERIIRNLMTIGFKNSFARFVFNLIQSIESRFFYRGEHKTEAQLLHIRDAGIPILRVKPIYSESKLVLRIQNYDLKIIKNHKLDLLIRGGRHILRDGILEVCPYGVLGIHHGDNEKFRGLPSGFWEVYSREPFTGYIFQQLRNELDDGVVFFKGQLPTKRTAYENTLYLHQQARIDFVEFIEQISSSGSFPEPIEREGDLVPLLRAPTVGQLIRYFWQSLFR